MQSNVHVIPSFVQALTSAQSADAAPATIAISICMRHEDEKGSGTVCALVSGSSASIGDVAVEVTRLTLIRTSRILNESFVTGNLVCLSAVSADFDGRKPAIMLRVSRQGGV
jgi:hypothetical protein